MSTMPMLVVDPDTQRVFLHTTVSFSYSDEGEPTGLTARYLYVGQLDDLHLLKRPT